MGYDELENMNVLTARNFSAGWFPGKYHGDVPGDFADPSVPIGASSCDHVIWYRGGLRKMFGYDHVNPTALPATGAAAVTGFIDFTNASNSLVGTIGAKLYKDLHTTSPTDITGAITISAGYQVEFVEYRIGGTKYIIGVNGQNPPFKWTGSGNAAALGGSPPNCKWIAYFNNYIFLANVSGNEEKIYFSALSNPESWDTTNRMFTFDDAITGLGVYGRMLVVFKRSSIGVIAGFGSSSWTKTDKLVSGVGCVGGHTIKNGRLGGAEPKDVLLFLSDDGVYAFDGTANVVKLSHSISDKFTSSTSTSRFNEARLQYATATFSNKYNWYILSLSDGGDSINDMVIVLDMSHPFMSPDGMICVPHWPMDGVTANAICTRKSSDIDNIYFGDDVGFVYLYDETAFAESTGGGAVAAYTGYWHSKIFDIKKHWLLRETNVLGDNIGDTDIRVYINADLESGYGQSATINMYDSADLIGTTFVLDSSVLGGKTFLYRTANINNCGRFLSFRLSQDIIDEKMIVNQIDIYVKEMGFRPNV
jgi:hypothetical protein